MKKLTIFIICCFLAIVSHAQQKKNLNQRLNAQVTRQVNKAQQNAPVKIAGDKRLISVRLEIQEPEDEKYILHRYWSCPAVIFNKEGALAFDGECWQAFEEAAKLPIGPVAHFRVDFGKLGEYTHGEEAGNLFYFEGTYVDGEGDEYTHGIDEAFARSADKSYIVYKLSLFKDPKNGNNPNNSEVKQAITQYYQQNNLTEINAETLSKYFKQTHMSTRKVLTRIDR